MEILSAIKNDPLDTQAKALIEVLKKSFKGSLYATCKYLLGYKDINWRTHGDMIRALEEQTTRKLIVMPRGTFKSSIGCVGYPIWLLMKDPNLRILIDSEVYSNSKNFLREIKAHMHSKLITELFGDWMGSPWGEGELTIKQRTIQRKEASITCGGIGTVKVGQHYDVIIGDDLNSGNNSETPEGCEKVYKHYQMNTSILEPGGTYVVIGTRYSTADVIGKILENEIGIK